VAREQQYIGRKITASFGNVTVREEKDGKSKGGSRWPTVCLSVYSTTENIYCSQLSLVAILLQPEPVSHRIIQGKDCVLSPSVLSSCGLPLPPTCLLVTVNEARSHFASTILVTVNEARSHFASTILVTVNEARSPFASTILVTVNEARSPFASTILVTVNEARSYFASTISIFRRYEV
jgi:hypothetical protein